MALGYGYVCLFMCPVVLPLFMSPNLAIIMCLHDHENIYVQCLRVLYLSACL